MNRQEEKITIEPELWINGRFCLHYLENGEEVWQEEENFDSVEERNGKTYVCYYTGWEDCPYEGYYVRESKEEVIALVNEVRDKISEAYKKYKIVETVQEEKQEDDIDLELEDFCPRTLLTDEEMEQASKIAEDARLESVKYIFSVIKKDGYGLKGAKTYFDLYIDKRNEDKKN